MQERKVDAMATVTGGRNSARREGTMTVVTATIGLATEGEGHVGDITHEVADAVRRSGLHDGTVTVFVPGATGAVTTIEYEPGVVTDFEELFAAIVPRDGRYHHDRNLGDGNGHSHVRAGLLGPSLTVPFVDGALTLGTWQSIVFVDFDNRPRRRSLVAQVMGV
jgi:secondary thiamine-phosphate synthase enzyme